MQRLSTGQVYVLTRSKSGTPNPPIRATIEVR
jgi:hypothetical protein